MKRLLFAAVLLAPLAAQAADLPYKAPLGVPVVAPFVWQGCYAAMLSGANTGSNQTGAVEAGALLGCNWQLGALVYGLEGDAAATQGSLGPAPKTVDFKALANLSARLGYAYHPMTPVALGPLTLTDALLYVKVGLPADYFNPDNTIKTGWAVSGGVEFPIRPFTTMGYEYRFNDVEGNHSHTFLTRLTLYNSGP